jgi:hypothetical protein
MAFCLVVLACFGGLHVGEELTDAQKTELAQHFGFDTFQIYKLKPDIQQLRLADLDGDGRTDIALWNYWKNRIELFCQPDPDAEGGASDAATELERNELPNRGDLRMENVPVAYRLACMDVAELTGDGRPDIVFFGEPKELVVLPGREEGGFGPGEGIRAPQGDPRGGSLAVGDFNHDGKTDVALLGEDVILVFHQKPGGGLSKPVRLVHQIKNSLLMLTADLNGDGGDDLIVGVDDEEYGAFVFLQEGDGTLGAMRRVKVPKLRSVTIAKGVSGDDVFAVESATGRLKHYRWESPAQAIGLADWPQLLYSYPAGGKSKQRSLAIGDVTGDGIADIVTADPDAAQLVLFKGGRDGLGPGTAFPGLVKTVDVQIGDIDNDGHNEVLSVSQEEKTVGVSRFEAGRLTFPSPVPIEGTPQMITVGSLRVDGEPVWAACLLTRENGMGEEEAPGKTAARKRETLIKIVAAGDSREIALWMIDDLEDDAAGLRFADVNQDGRNDLLLFVRYSPLRTYIQQEDGSFAVLKGPEAREGLVKQVSLEGFALADVNGDGKLEVLLAQKNLTRALVVADGGWTVVDQCNPESADAQVKGLAALVGEEGSPTLAMYDRKASELLVFERRADGLFAVAKTMPIGRFEVVAMEALPVGVGGEEALLLADSEQLALFYPGRVAPTLVEKHSYETSIKDAWLGDSVVGDLNHDGVRDVVAVDIRKANLEILTTGPDGDLVKALRFQVFQGKRFSDEPDRGGDPREVLIGDVTGDGIDDIVLLAHDRLIVYPAQ